MSLPRGTDFEVVEIVVREDDVLDGVLGGRVIVTLVVSDGDGGTTSCGHALDDPGETGMCLVISLWPVESMIFATTFFPSTCLSATHAKEVPVISWKSSITAPVLASTICSSNAGTPPDHLNVTVEHNIWAGIEGLSKLSVDAASTVVRSHIMNIRI